MGVGRCVCVCVASPLASSSSALSDGDNGGADSSLGDCCGSKHRYGPITPPPPRLLLLLSPCMRVCIIVCVCVFCFLIWMQACTQNLIFGYNFFPDVLDFACQSLNLENTYTSVLWEFGYVWFVCVNTQLPHLLCICTPLVCHSVCVCVSHICSSKRSLCGSLCVSASSFIPPDIPASFLWAPEQLATPVGHFHNETITIYEPSATHSLIRTHPYSMQHPETHSPVFC